MKWDRGDIEGYLKTQVIRDIIGLIGMIILGGIGIAKKDMRLLVVAFSVSIFISYELIKTIIKIKKLK